MSTRKERGAWYTPPALAAALVTRALEGLEPGATVIDLACGDGALLDAARGVGSYRLVGFDIDPDAVRAARKRLPEGEFHCADGLTVDVPHAHAVLGNPPFLFGARRPAVDVDRFTLAKGQWDTAWLFLERGLALLEPGGRLGYVLPDSILARHETVAVRRLVRGRAKTVHIRHDPPSFDAHVATVLLCATVDPEYRGAPTLEMNGQRYPLHHDSSWPPAPPVPDGWLRLGDLVHISRGEELGKRHLTPIGGTGTGHLTTVGEGARSVPVLAGAGVVHLGQPQPTHWCDSELVRKPSAHYQSPKVVVVKTGSVVRAGVDMENLVTLQSVYNLRPLQPGLQWARFLCGVLGCAEVQRRFILPHTSGKKVFPQITQTLLASVCFPRPTGAVVEAIANAVEAGDTDLLDARTGPWFACDAPESA